ncbi:unnamed protein product [Nesidiocoris tenuis]|uniref:Uncharacterized protein n=1 Tax=Nesidiocoris tenuis TaxID=355587 RepID=A0A6H5GJP9_9HEMI|nr:unnamed protein product [Nesidiocoris tenuis]
MNRKGRIFHAVDIEVRTHPRFIKDRCTNSSNARLEGRIRQMAQNANEAITAGPKDLTIESFTTRFEPSVGVSSREHRWLRAASQKRRSANRKRGPRAWTRPPTAQTRRPLSI